MNVKELDGNRLMLIRNPHGNKGAEWTGDWSDKSSKWTERLKKLANFVDADDGMFWMSIEDYLYKFEDIYLCRVFD